MTPAKYLFCLEIWCQIISVKFRSFWNMQYACMYRVKLRFLTIDFLVEPKVSFSVIHTLSLNFSMDPTDVRNKFGKCKSMTVNHLFFTRSFALSIYMCAYNLREYIKWSHVGISYKVWKRFRFQFFFFKWWRKTASWTLFPFSTFLTVFKG